VSLLRIFIAVLVCTEEQRKTDVARKDDDARPTLKSWMVYALAFAIVYSLVAWPCVYAVCFGKESPDAADVETA